VNIPYPLDLTIYYSLFASALLLAMLIAVIHDDTDNTA
jgi:hypothetical protein